MFDTDSTANFTIVATPIKVAVMSVTACQLAVQCLAAVYAAMHADNGVSQTSRHENLFGVNFSGRLGVFLLKFPSCFVISELKTIGLSCIN